MSNLDDMFEDIEEFTKETLYSEGHKYESPEEDEVELPKGWERSATFNGIEGELVSGAVPEGENPDWNHLIARLEKAGFSKDDFEIQEPFTVKTWEAYTKADGIRVYFSYRANIVSKKHRLAPGELDELIEEIKQDAPIEVPVVDETDGYALVVGLADWQIGKRDRGGHLATVRRILKMKRDLKQRIVALEESGKHISAIYLAGLGDLGEGCDGHYAMQTFQVELTRREQENLIRRMLIAIIREIAPLAPRVVVLSVPGNHGENRKDGKAFTTFSDNTDVAVFEQVYDVLKFNPDAYSHVSFVLPDDDLVVTLNINGTNVAFAHGHQFRMGGGKMAYLKALNWWKSQMYGGQDASSAEILISGHYHHLSIVREGHRTHIQAPALEGGSDWYKNTNGVATQPGTLTFLVNGDGWSDLQIL